MSGSSFGTIFRITTWGESHGPAIGVTVEGVPAGLAIEEEYIQGFLDRRKPGVGKYATKRKESDTVHILSGVFEGKATGTPISMVIYNEDQRSKDYSNIMNTYRPGHADFTFDAKYGFRDYRGGGRSSARETAARVAAGAIAIKLLSHLGIDIMAYTLSIGDVEIDKDRFDPKEISNNSVSMPDAKAAAKAAKLLDECMKNMDSAGGVIECVTNNLPAGLGETVFDKLDALLGQALFSIGAVKGVEIGSGFEASRACGSKNNDPFVNTEGKISKSSNNSGGVLGGMSDGAPLIIRAAIKPTPSIAREQSTVDKWGNETTLSIKGRHDPVIVPRAVVVVESMVALVIADLLLRNMSAKLEYVEKIYRP